MCHPTLRTKPHRPADWPIALCELRSSNNYGDIGAKIEVGHTRALLSFVMKVFSFVMKT